MQKITLLLIQIQIQLVHHLERAIAVGFCAARGFLQMVVNFSDVEARICLKTRCTETILGMSNFSQFFQSLFTSLWQ